MSNLHEEVYHINHPKSKMEKCFVNHSAGYLYINISKNASTSLRSSILFEEYAPYTLFNARDYIKFVVFRNPFDRVVSSFMELKKLRADGPCNITLGSEWYSKKDLQKSFEEFLYFIEDNFYDRHVFPQITFLEHKGVSLSDMTEILLFDTLEVDYAKLIRKYPKITSKSKKLQHKRKSNNTQVAILKKMINSNTDIYEHIKRIYTKDCEIYDNLNKTRITT